MICVNCGRPLNGKICDYCGTDYRTDEEKKKDNKCDHIYDVMFYEDDIKNCCAYLLFKCDHCGEETKMRITRRLRSNLIGGYL